MYVAVAKEIISDEAAVTAISYQCNNAVSQPLPISPDAISLRKNLPSFAVLKLYMCVNSLVLRHGCSTVCKPHL